MEPTTIFDLSKRTVTKIFHRLKLGCSNCGWDEDRCDIHHILPKSKGGNDDHNNLTYLCPNCHRKAHSGKLNKFATLSEQIGDSWKTVYYPDRDAGRMRMSKAKKTEANNIWFVYMKKRIELAESKVDEKVERLKESGINFSKYGWVKEAAPILGIKENKVNWWLKRYKPSFLNECYVRKKR